MDERKPYISIIILWQMSQCVLQAEPQRHSTSPCGGMADATVSWFLVTFIFICQSCGRGIQIFQAVSQRHYFSHGSCELRSTRAGVFLCFISLVTLHFTPQCSSHPLSCQFSMQSARTTQGWHARTALKLLGRLPSSRCTEVNMLDRRHHSGIMNFRVISLSSHLTTFERVTFWRCLTRILFCKHKPTLLFLKYYIYSSNTIQNFLLLLTIFESSNTFL